jgi:hypothetical protein
MRRSATSKVIRHEEDELDRIEEHLSQLGCTDYEEYIKELIACDMFNGDYQKRMNIRKSMEVILDSAKNLGVDPEVAELVITKLLNGQINKNTLTQPIVPAKQKIDSAPTAKLISSPSSTKMSLNEHPSPYAPENVMESQGVKPTIETHEIMESYCAKAYPRDTKTC